jgi:urease beta subunit
MAGISTSGPGAVRVRPGTIELNADRTPDERLELVILNTGDRPVQIGSHLHLPDANAALDFDRAAAHGFRLDVPSGTSRRFEPGASAVVQAVALRGARRVPGIQLKADGGWLDGPPGDDGADDDAHDDAGAGGSEENADG